MGMKDPKNEPQGTLAPNLVSGPKDVAGSDYSNLVSTPKGTADTMAEVGPNLISHQGHAGTKNPG